MSLTREKLDVVSVLTLTNLPWQEICRLQAAGLFPPSLDERGNEFDRDEIEAWIAQAPPMGGASAPVMIDQADVSIGAAGIVCMVGGVSFCLPWEIIHRAEEAAEIERQ